MSTEVWKSFEENQLTHSAAHYLMTIYDLLLDKGYARVTDVAKRLNITRGSCSISLKALKKKGLVEEDENRFLRLSVEGRRLAELVEYNDQLLEFFFRDFLGVSPDQAEIDACKIEHLLSIESSMALHSLVKLIREEHPAAMQLIAELRKVEEDACRHDTRHCETCQTTCFFEAPLNIEGKPVPKNQS